VEGWTPTILFLSFAFFGVFGILAIVIKYLSIIVELIFKKRQYVYESIQKISK
ncbi:MAG: polyisoprenyl-phosphate glycosyltransferase, partial [Clostridiales bacterium]|nr:polyisoprenyl-phosphate glycosyltransferase [Clostridiales bacterium]